MSEVYIPSVLIVMTPFYRDSFYTTLGNAMDYACGMFPVTTVDAELDQPHPPHNFHNHEDEAIYKLCTPVILAQILLLTNITRYSRALPRNTSCIAVDRPNIGGRGCNSDDRDHRRRYQKVQW